MPTYAVLGATGATGSALVTHLQEQPDVHLHLYARSESRLTSKFPSMASNPNVKLFYGAISDTALLARCLSGVSTIFSTVATNCNEPNCSVARTTAASIVGALERLKREHEHESSVKGSFQVPRLIWLSSASLYPPSSPEMNKFVKSIIYRALWYIYEDLREAEAYMAAEAPWLPVTRACPGALYEQEPQGVVVGEKVRTEMVGYADLAVAMVMLAEDESLRGKSAGITSKGAPRPDLLLKANGHRLVLGLLSSYVPGAFRLFDWLGWW